MEALVAFEEGNLVLGDDLGPGMITVLAGEWRLLYTSSNAMEYNQVRESCDRSCAAIRVGFRCCCGC